MSGLVPWARGTQSQALVPYQQSVAVAPTPPTSMRDWWKELHGNIQPEQPGPVQSAVVGLRQNAESAAIGALLALIDTDLGGLDLGGRIPLDWTGAAIFYALSIQGANKADSLALDYRAMGQSCTTIAMFRTIHKWREAKKGMTRNNTQLSGDPVLRASKAQF